MDGVKAFNELENSNVAASKIQHIRLTKVNKSSLGMLLHHVDNDLGYSVNRLKD
jgi:hypothetical protein